ncbi:(5-formylfuran-3-yl)methyl phosphate synthase [Thalassoroseus pseudoceratinae]|uniref:(5-formylfuran-3-yl)methyl phosphate synthase n=1 Tax=Thalassoroseus pseudoceratinae TaxID=2713176 RepID=UPI00141DEBD4|nr:(5-formylfuran-3-yl)methyl phosphate synthase [Thalassoroseus pseudoceratinae]
MVPQLLISVRNADEAQAAIEGGCDILDIKEPSRGSLGRADDTTIHDIIDSLGSDAPPVSAALGELRDIRKAPASSSLPAGLAYVKLGLAGCAKLPHWDRELRDVRDSITSQTATPRWVRAIYADHELANAPAMEEVLQKATGTPPVTLFDTFTKDGRTLTDCVEPTRFRRLCNEIREQGSRVALAGALNADSLPELADVPCDILAIRTAACRNGDRNGPICPDAIRRFQEVVNEVFA